MLPFIPSNTHDGFLVSSRFVDAVPCARAADPGLVPTDLPIATSDLVKILEPHGYTAVETQRHLLWEYINWLDKYVKNAPRRAATSATAGTPAPK